MFCPKCGKEVADNVIFCTFCGNKMPANQDTATEVSEQILCPPFENPLSNAKPELTEMIRKLLLSRTFLVAIISLSAYILFKLLGNFGAYSELSDFLSEAGPYGDYAGVLYNPSGSSSAIGTLIGLIPSILVVIGGWMLYASARKTQSGAISPAGMSVIRVAPIINLVVVCLFAPFLCVVALAASLMGLAGIKYSDSLGGIFGVGLMLFLFLLVVAVVIYLIVFGVKSISTVNTLKAAIETGAITKKISKLVIVTCYIFGVISALGVLCSVLTQCLTGVYMYEIANSLGSEYSPNILLTWFSLIMSSLATIGSAVSFFCFGRILSRYKKRLSAIFTATN